MLQSARKLYGDVGSLESVASQLMTSGKMKHFVDDDFCGIHIFKIPQDELGLMLDEEMA